MRTYLRIVVQSPHYGEELAMVCNCGKQKMLTEFVPAGVRPLKIQSINLFRLMQWAGEWMQEHNSCPNEPPEPPLPF